MIINVEWKNKQSGEEVCEVVPLTVGCLLVYHQNDLITKTDWSLENLALTSNKGFCINIQAYMNHSTDCLNVKLLKQGTDFRYKVWDEILRIPKGQVISYTDLANKVSSGARAVANACRDNPFPGIIPCHRVVAINGLGGYMGNTRGELFEIKNKLLRLESVMIES